MKYRLLSILINNISVNPVLIFDFHVILLIKKTGQIDLYFTGFFFKIKLNFQLHEKHFIFL